MRASLVSVCAICVGLAGCARSPDLEPAIADSEIDGLDDAAGVVVSRVQIVVQPGEWPEERAVPDHVTPMLVEIWNGSREPLRLEYRLFALDAGGDKALAALPPFNVYGTQREPRVTREGARIELVYEAERFEVAPFYADVYRDVPRYSRPFIADQSYYGAHWGYWKRTGEALPTRAMQLMALPEGVLHPAGRVAGYLYFEKVPAGADRVQFNFSLVDAEDGRIFAIAAVPFVVDR